MSESRIKWINGLHGCLRRCGDWDSKQSESGFSGFKDSQDDFIENPSLHRSAMSIEGLGKVGNNDPPFRESESCSVQSPLLWKGQKPSFSSKLGFSMMRLIAELAVVEFLAYSISLQKIDGFCDFLDISFFNLM